MEFDVSKYVDKEVSLEESRKDDTKGDINTASKWLQEFQDMAESPHDFFKSPAEEPPEPRTSQKEHLNCSEGETPEAANGATKHGPQNGIPPKVKPKTRGRKASIQGRGRGLQMEQEARVEGGGQWEWSDVVAELKRGGDAEYGGHRGRGRGGYRGQGGPRVGTGGGTDERGHESPRTMDGKWVQGQGRMTEAQNMPAVNQTFDEHRHDETLNEQDTALFERKKLLVSGLDEKTTDNRVLTFIKAMSEEEVEDVVMLGKGRALVTMLQDITSK